MQSLPGAARAQVGPEVRVVGIEALLAQRLGGAGVVGVVAVGGEPGLQGGEQQLACQEVQVAGEPEAEPVAAPVQSQLS